MFNYILLSGELHIIIFYILVSKASLGPVVNILAIIISNAKILKKLENKRYHIKGMGCPLLISINIDTLGLQ